MKQVSNDAYRTSRGTPSAPPTLMTVYSDFESELPVQIVRCGFLPAFAETKQSYLAARVSAPCIGYQTKVWKKKMMVSKEKSALICSKASKMATRKKTKMRRMRHSCSMLRSCSRCRPAVVLLADGGWVSLLVRTWLLCIY